MHLINFIINYFVFLIKHHTIEDFVKRSQTQKKTKQNKKILITKNKKSFS